MVDISAVAPEQAAGALRATGRSPWPRSKKLGALVLTALMTVGVVCVAPVRVAGHSMEPTLGPGSHVLTLRHLGFLPVLPDPIHRGSIVTARDPDTGTLVIKRVVALGGDSVGIADGRLVVNGTSPHEPFVDHSRVDSVYFGPVRVPAGSVFLLGDNRGDSRDSRDFGPVRAREITGRVVLRLWPPGR